MARPSGRRTSQFQLKQPQPAPSVPSLDNDFRGGLKTEFTGLNFPENACTATSNCRFTRVGNVARRGGLDTVGTNRTITTTSLATSSFTWTNAGGSGNVVMQVEQVGTTLYFYQVTNATLTSGVSGTFLTSISFSSFVVGANPTIQECQYATGNGYLFVYHPACDPFYCTFDGVSTITANVITLQFRDFQGIPEPGVADNFRPTTLSAEHQYNIINQGWTSGTPWTASIFSNGAGGLSVPCSGSFTWTINSQTNTTSVTVGSSVQIVISISTGTFYCIGTVTAYSTPFTSLTMTITSNNFPNCPFAFNFATISANLLNVGFIQTWFTKIGNYPSNSDIWWTFKNSTGVFDPLNTVANVQLTFTPAPKGSFILNVFNQNRSTVSGVAGLTAISTTVRPRTGAFFQGRVWYTGVDASQPPTGDEPFTTWTENIYFSQIIESTSQFGRCYQTNDPTSQNTPEILPTDGGVINIPGAGSIFKLFPIVNGLIVFAANGIWFITGNTGLGFTATDYSITKLSGEHALSSTSFVDVAGYPMFWNADGIYYIAPGQTLTSGQRGLEVKNLTLDSIKQFYQAIPLVSRQYARGSYNHVTGEVQWCYRSTAENGIGNRYTRDSILTFLVYTDAFWNWTIGGPGITDVIYLELPNNFNIPAAFFYPCFSGSNYNFAQEFNNVFSDFTIFNGSPVNYVSNFTTAYRLKGQALKKFQPEYVYVFSESSTTQYKIQGVWNYALSNASNKFSTVQVINNNTVNFGKNYRRLRIRGQGYILQFNITSVDAKPFNISGWSVLDQIGVGV